MNAKMTSDHNGKLLDSSGQVIGFMTSSVDARRLVACANACAGTSSEDIESGAVMVCGSNQVAYFEELKTKNAVLEAALAESRANDAAAMRWLTDARFASGDRGKRMLPEFIEYLKEMKQKNVELQEQVECSNITEANMEGRLNLALIKMAKMNEDLTAARNALLREGIERGELLAALEFAKEKIAELHIEAGDGECHYPMIDDAIAREKGGAA